jgi:hypothetical protein
MQDAGYAPVANPDPRKQNPGPYGPDKKQGQHKPG